MTTAHYAETPTWHLPRGARTVFPSQMNSGDTVIDFEGRTSIRIDQVEMIRIHHWGRLVPVWWIKGVRTGFGDHQHTPTVSVAQTVSVARQPWYRLPAPGA